MATANVKINNITYNDVPSIFVPSADGGDDVEFTLPTTPTYDTPTISVSTGGLITASANGKSNTQQLTVQAAKTVTPTKSSQTAVASGRYTTGAVSVGAIPSEYIIPSGSQTITENGTVDVTSLASVIVNVAGGGGGGISGATLLYSNDAESITYTSTTAGTAKTITGVTGIATYPIVGVIIENTNSPDTAESLKFRRSATFIMNNNFAAGSVSVTRYGAMQYYNSSSTATQTASTSYGLWGYTFTAAGNLTIRGRCNTAYFTSLTGTYRIRVIGFKFT